MNQAKILHDVHVIRHFTWSLITVEHNLHDQTSQNDDADACMFLVSSYYVDDSQVNSYKQWNEHMETVHHLVCWESIQYNLSSYYGCLQSLLAKQA